jgi:hypothetical protein
MSFEEKSTWINLIVNGLIFGGYFTFAFGVLTGGETPETALIPAFISTMILVILVHIFLHTLLALIFWKEAEQGGDERDHLIDLKATRIAYYILVVGIFSLGGGLFFSPTPFVIANTILFFFILAELASASTKIFLYRRGI